MMEYVEIMGMVCLPYNTNFLSGLLPQVYNSLEKIMSKQKEIVPDLYFGYVYRSKCMDGLWTTSLIQSEPPIIVPNFLLTLAVYFHHIRLRVKI